jgi:hypothetical protein
MAPPRAKRGAADEEAFEGAEGFLVGLAVGFAAGEVLARRSIDPRLGDGDDVDGVVELAVAGAVEAVALLFARGGVQRRDAGI